MSDLSSYMRQCPLVAILRGVTPLEVDGVADILAAAGFCIMEIPLNSPNALVSIERLARRFDQQILVGAGTVLEVGSVARVAAAGGRLIVAPNADADVVMEAKRMRLSAVPGVFTPTEAFSMIKAGADALKLFPAEAASPSVLRAMRTVLPAGTAVLPVGGIRPESLEAWWQAGAAGFGLGSALYTPSGTLDQIQANAQAFLKALA